MGAHPNIRHDQFPAQSLSLNKRVLVFFDYDLANRIGGVIRRDDRQEPYRMIIELDDGRLVMSTECQYQIVHSS